MDLRSLRDVEVADVVKGDRRAATLRRVEDGVAFEYLDEYRRDRGPAVALTLPVTEEPAVQLFRDQAEPFARLRQSKAVAQLQHRRRLLQP